MLEVVLDGNYFRSARRAGDGQRSETGCLNIRSGIRW
jgi:hypothetical protein